MRPWTAGLKPVALCLPVAVACWCSVVATPLYWLSARITDALVRLAPSRPSPHLLVVAIDDASLQALGRFPFDRRVYAQMLDRLGQAGAKVVAFDLLFVEPSPSDGVLAGAMRRFGKVALSVGVVVKAREGEPPPRRFLLPLNRLAPALSPSDLLEAPAIVLPPRPLRDASAAIGLVIPYPDPDGVCRRLPLVFRWRGSDKGVPSLSLSAWALWAGRKAWKSPLPLNPDGSVWVTPPVDRGSEVGFPTLSLAKVVRGEFDPARVRGKVVLVGLTASGLSDRLPTPTDPLAFGVEIHAAALNALLMGRNLTVASELAQGAFCLALGLLFGLVGTSRQPWGNFAALIGASAAIMTGTWAAIRWLSLAIPPLPLLLSAWGCWTALTSWLLHRQRQAYEQLSAYIAYPALDELTHTPERLQVGERKEISVLFSDIRDFTRLAASLTPYEVVTLLGTYFTRMTEIVNLYGGTVNKFLGDGMMALFGLGENQFDHAERAVICACHMLEEIESLQAEWQRVTGEPLRIGIGIHSGIAVVGIIGSEQRKEFTAVGATVNLAQRLEQLTKEVKAHLVISEETYQRVADLVVAEPISGVVLRGYEEVPMTVYRVHGLTEEMRRLRSQFWVVTTP